MPGAVEPLEPCARQVLREKLAVARVDDHVLGPGLDQRRRTDLGQAVEAVERRAGGRLRGPGGRRLSGREAVREDRLDDLGALGDRLRRERVLDEPPERDEWLETPEPR